MRLKDYKDKVTIVRSNFHEIKDVLNGLNIDKANGILLDLGFHPISWILRKEAFHTVRMRPLT